MVINLLCYKVSSALGKLLVLWQPDETVSDFKGRHCPGEIVFWAVLWYCRYGISYRDLKTMITERGTPVDHSTIFRRMQRYAPEIEKRMRWRWWRPMQFTLPDARLFNSINGHGFVSLKSGRGS